MAVINQNNGVKAGRNDDDRQGSARILVFFVLLALSFFYVRVILHLTHFLN